MSASDSAVPHQKRKITFIPSDTWCDSAATKSYELCRAGPVLYGFKDVFYDPPTRIGEFIRPRVNVGYIDDAFVLPGAPILVSRDGLVPTERFLGKAGAAYYLQSYAEESVPAALKACFNGRDGGIELSLPADVVTLDYEAILLGGSQNFGHFLNEHLLRLPLLEMFPETRDKPVLLYDFVPDRFIAFMELAGVSRNRIVRVPSTRPLSCKRLWFSSAPIHWRNDPAPAFWAEAFHMLRARIMASLPKRLWGTRERLYLPRGVAAHRRLLNESDVIDVFQRRGFRCATLADLSAVEQVQVIAGCGTLAGALGAALSISALAPSDCPIVQLQSAKRTLLYNSELQAIAIGQTLGTVVGEAAVPAGQEPRGIAYDDFVVPTRTIEETLDRLAL